MLGVLLIVAAALAEEPRLTKGGPRGQGAGGAPTRVGGAPGRMTAMGERGIQRGQERLRAGQFGFAADRFTVELEADPGSIPARRGLALARSGQRQCDRSVPLLEELRALGAWDVDLAVAEGNCALRAGDVSRATVAFEEAVLLDPTDADAWLGLTNARQEAGDWPGYEDALAALRETEWKAPRAPVMAATAEATAWRTVGGDDAWTALAYLYDMIDTYAGKARAGRIDAFTMEGELWLDLGDPIAADRSFRKGVGTAMRAPRVGALHAEATRRLGDAEAARRILEEGKARRGGHVVKEAVWVRVHVDLGELELAEEAARALPADNLDAQASRWYLARARGDADAMARAERRWRDLGPSPEASLEQLVPWWP